MKTIKDLKTEREDLSRDVKVPAETIEMLENVFFKKRHEWMCQEAPDMEIATEMLINKYPDELNKEDGQYAEFETFIYKILPKADIDNVLILTDDEIINKAEKPTDKETPNEA